MRDCSLAVCVQTASVGHGLLGVWTVVTVIVSELAKFLVDVTRRTAKQLAPPLAPVDMPAREHEPFRGLRPFWWHQCPMAEVDVLNQLQVLAVTHPEFYPGLKAFRQHARQLAEAVD